MDEQANWKKDALKELLKGMRRLSVGKPDDDEAAGVSERFKRMMPLVSQQFLASGKAAAGGTRSQGDGKP